jgi:hypothetical protein
MKHIGTKNESLLKEKLSNFIKGRHLYEKMKIKSTMKNLSIQGVPNES